jgi:hypothetical protein
VGGCSGNNFFDNSTVQSVRASKSYPNRLCLGCNQKKRYEPNNTVIGHFDDAFCNLKKLGSTCNMVLLMPVSLTTKG